MPKVYDITNAGPRNKFMVRSKQTKQLAIVHNCYLTGWRKLHMTARLWGSPIDTHVAQLAHASYRVAHPSVVDTWAYYEDLLQRWAGGAFVDEVFGIFHVENKGIRTPSGFLLQYPDLKMGWRQVGRSSVRSYTYWNASKGCRVNVHPGLVHEQCCQSSAAQVFNDMHRRIQPRAESIGGTLVGSVHDEFIYRVPVGSGRAMLDIMQDEMGKPPVWWPELPVTSEGDHGFGVLEHDGTFNLVSRYGLLK